MKNTYNIYTIVGFLVAVQLSTSGCKKYLDEKPVKSVVTINTLKDLQAILNNDLYTQNYISITTAGADEYYLNNENYGSLNEPSRLIYLWDKNSYHGPWAQCYRLVYYANVVLQELDKIEGGSEIERNYIKGQALFLRAFFFYELAQVYCKPYTADAATDPGIALRIVPDLEVASKRASVAQTYEQIIKDLKAAAGYLKPTREFVSRPYKASAYGLLSRTFMAMRDYEQALHYANLYLEASPDLVDFNDLDPALEPAFTRDNVEIAYYATNEDDIVTYEPPIDTLLYAMYEDDDLRRSIYFKTGYSGTPTFRGSYSVSYAFQPFSGIATDEMYLNRAECYARAGKVSEAMLALNALLIKRWKKDEFTDRTANNKEEALQLVLRERRKELVYRGSRWTDVRRLNIEGENIELKRVIDGQTYVLPANDKRSVWLLPLEVIQRSGMQQNER
ncbi:tetratricopeptide (TPR) repeat protein [Pedobacter africanus]|uniref:RagB/SusD family nutrient uptake outer membrane protein n=1 Tax=Pedobacter africanus TaxID=151894 RepID=UPI003391E9B3